MEDKSKYDTNPLDPDFVRRTEPVASADTSDITLPLGAQNDTDARRRESAEAPTLRYDNRPDASYPSVFQSDAYRPPPVRQNYEPPPLVAPNSYSTKPGCHTVSGLNLPERVACVLPYAPFYIGIVASAVELFLTPRVETRTRFHAAQGLALQLAILGITLLFNFLRLFTGSGLGGFLFKIAAVVFLIVSMVRVWKGEAHRIAPLADATKWLNETIEPRK
ncbi:MAG: hypothetical protein ACR2LC_07255 [Pyrinomonadaceae bacterium]